MLSRALIFIKMQEVLLIWFCGVQQCSKWLRMVNDRKVGNAFLCPILLFVQALFCISIIFLYIFYTPVLVIVGFDYFF